MTRPPVRRTRLAVDLEAVRHNVRRLAAAAGDAQVCAVVKADGYGHGAVDVACAALEAGATHLAVALVEEGEQLRDAGVDAPVLLLSEPPSSAAARLVAAGLTPTVYTRELGTALDAIARHEDAPVRVHLGFDTGMGRVGAPPDRWDDLLEAVAGWHVDVEGVWTHLARADEPDASTTAEQLARFGDLLGRIRTAGLGPRLVHAANSAATLLHPGAAFDLVRPGIAVYGLSPAPDVTADDHGLRQALRLVTEVSYAKHVRAGTPLSYGHTWAAPADGWVATVPAGYADGVPRLVSNHVDVLHDGVRRPLVGRVTMDQSMVWCGDQEPHAGDEVVLLGGQGEQFVSVDEWAAAVGTISYEIACGISARVPRVVVG
jgi:alanine racemase